MKKRIIIGGSVVIAVICIIVVVLILKWDNQKSEIVSDSVGSIDLGVTVEEAAAVTEEEQNIDLMVENNESNESTEDVVEIESSEDIQTETSIEIETNSEEAIETAVTEDAEVTEEVNYAAKYHEAIERYNELKEKGAENLSDDEKFLALLYAQDVQCYSESMLFESQSKLQEAMAAVGISGSIYGSAFVENLTEEDEPYYSILQSVDAIGYYFTVNGAVSDTVYLFYTNQDGEVVYYGFVDLLDY